MLAKTPRKLELGVVGRRSGMALFAIVARSLQQASTLLITLLAARFLLPAEYGIYGLGVVFLMLMQTLTYTGFYQFIVTSREDDRVVLSTSFWMMLGLSVIASVLLILAAYPLERLFDADQLGTVLVLLALAQPVAGFGAWSSAALLRRGAVNTNFVVMFCQNLIALVGGAILLWMWQSLFALVAFRYLRVFSGTLLYFVLGRDLPSLQFAKPLAKTALSFSGGLYGSRLLAFLAKYSGDLLLGLIYSAAEVGLYRFGTRIAGGATDTLTQPMSSFAITQFGAAARGDRSLDAPLARFAGTITLLTGMIAAVVIVFAEDAIELLFNISYLGAVVVAYAMALRGVAGIGQLLIEPIFSALGRTSWVMMFNLVTAAVSVLAIFVATPFGLAALAWTQAAVVLAATGWAFYLMGWKGGLSVRGAVRGFVVAAALAGAYGLAVAAIRAWLMPVTGLDGVPLLLAGLLAAAACVPLFLLAGWRLKVFTLHVFSG